MITPKQCKTLSLMFIGEPYRRQEFTMKRLLAIAGLFIFSSIIGLAQNLSNIEYGKTDELKGVTKVFVNTRGDKKSHDEVAGRIEKELPGVTVTDTPDDAEVILFFLGGDYGGDGVVYKISARGRARVLIDWKGSKGRFLGRDLEKKFAEAFIEAYRKANKLQKKNTSSQSTAIREKPTPVDTANGITWELVAEMKEHFIYYSPQTVTKFTPGTIRVWSKIVFKPNSTAYSSYVATRTANEQSKNGYRKFLYIKQLLECDCAQKKYRSLSLMDYSSDHDVLGSINDESDWAYMVPETPIYELIIAICSGRK